MPYFKAGTNIVGVPKEMVFYDKNDNPHLLKTLTPKNHIATHYGTSAIEFTNKKGNLVKTVTKGEYINYQKKVKKQKEAVKKAEKATVEVMKVEEKIKRKGRPLGSKNKPKIVATTSDGTPIAVATPAPTQKKRGPKVGRKQLKNKLQAMTYANSMVDNLFSEMEKKN